MSKTTYVRIDPVKLGAMLFVAISDQKPPPGMTDAQILDFLRLFSPGMFAIISGQVNAAIAFFVETLKATGDAELVEFEPAKERLN